MQTRMIGPLEVTIEETEASIIWSAAGCRVIVDKRHSEVCQLGIIRRWLRARVKAWIKKAREVEFRAFCRDARILKVGKEIDVTIHSARGAYDYRINFEDRKYAGLNQDIAEKTARAALVAWLEQVAAAVEEIR